MDVCLVAVMAPQMVVRKGSLKAVKTAGPRVVTSVCKTVALRALHWVARWAWTRAEQTALQTVVSMVVLTV